MKTYSTRLSDIKRERHVIDAKDEVLGRLATRIARLLMGKHKTTFARNVDMADFVVVINAAQVRVTGNKMNLKTYHRHSGYPGGFKTTTLEKMMQTHPERVIEYAVKGMLPTNHLRARMMKKLNVYAGELPKATAAPAKAD